MTNEMFFEDKRLNDEELDFISGGTQDEAREFRAMAVAKGYAKNMYGTAGGMAAHKMFEKIGVPHVNWHAKDNQPADFWDDNGNHYTFEQLKPRLETLPNKMAG